MRESLYWAFVAKTSNNSKSIRNVHNLEFTINACDLVYFFIGLCFE